MLRSFQVGSCSFLIVLLTASCSSPTTNIGFDYGSQSDSARYYFLKGWEEILDNGRWTESEIAFRKASDFDMEWLLGLSMVARITRDLDERKEILEFLLQNIDQVDPDERMLLDVNILSHIAANNRDQGMPNSQEFNQSRRVLAEKNFGAFARKFPEDNYFKAEYIEFLHANHGAQMALDSLKLLALPNQLKLGFYITYQAALNLELGNVDKAKELLAEYKSIHTNPSYLSPMVLEAQILQAEQKLEEALILMNQVIEADSNHLIAVGMKARLEQQITNGKN